MTISIPYRFLPAAIFIWMSTCAHAQIYKWVDADGRTHYSDKNQPAGTSKADELNVKYATVPSHSSAAPATEDWREQERRFQQRQVENTINKKNEPPKIAARPKSLSGGRSDDSAISKCNLAKDVMNGSVRHTNGAPIDEYDRKVAQDNIKAFCP